VQIPECEPLVTSCPNCGAAAAAEQRFWGECGAALAVTCPNCRAPIKAGQRFCADCGSGGRRAVLSDGGARGPFPVAFEACRAGANCVSVLGWAIGSAARQGGLSL